MMMMQIETQKTMMLNQMNESTNSNYKYNNQIIIGNNQGTSTNNNLEGYGKQDDQNKQILDDKHNNFSVE